MGQSNSKKPLIGVTGPAKGGAGNWLIMKLILLWYGANPYYLSSDLEYIPEALDGLVISGGADIDPRRYGKHSSSLPHEQKKQNYPWWTFFFYPIVKLYKLAFGIGSIEVDQERDALEWNLLESAFAKEIPVIGICRGMQLMNVYCGGSLHHNVNVLNNGTPYKKSILGVRAINVDKDSILYEVWQTTRCKINSLHNQGVDKLGNALRVSARDDNDLIQAVEHQHQHFALGVQWHPEYMPHKTLQMQLFETFVEKCRNPEPAKQQVAMESTGL